MVAKPMKSPEAAHFVLRTLPWRPYISVYISAVRGGHVRWHVLTALEDARASLTLPNQGGRLTD